MQSTVGSTLPQAWHPELCLAKSKQREKGLCMHCFFCDLDGECDETSCLKFLQSLLINNSGLQPGIAIWNKPIFSPISPFQGILSLSRIEIGTEAVTDMPLWLLCLGLFFWEETLNVFIWINHWMLAVKPKWVLNRNLENRNAERNVDSWGWCGFGGEERPKGKCFLVMGYFG